MAAKKTDELDALKLKLEQVTAERDKFQRGLETTQKTLAEFRMKLNATAAQLRETAIQNADLNSRLAEARALGTNLAAYMLNSPPPSIPTEPDPNEDAHV